MESYQIKFYKKYIQKSNIDAEQVITRFEEFIEDFQWVFIEKSDAYKVQPTQKCCWTLTFCKCIGPEK